MGDVIGKHNLAKMMNEGRGTRKNPELALDIWRPHCMTKRSKEFSNMIAWSIVEMRLNWKNVLI
jgi:hypothetical protein